LVFASDDVCLSKTSRADYSLLQRGDCGMLIEDMATTMEMTRLGYVTQNWDNIYDNKDFLSKTTIIGI